MSKWAVVSPVKDEIRLKEWILYYTKLQVDLFIIIDDYSTIPVKTYFDELNINNYEIIILNEPTLNSDTLLISWNTRTSAIKDNVLPICNKHNIDYILYIDADEFLYLNKCKNMQEVIQYYQPFDELKINWLLFNNYGLKTNETNSLIHTFTLSQKYINKFTKSFIKVSSIVTGLDAHSCLLHSPYISKNIFNNINIPKPSCTTTFKFSDINEIHYINCPLFIAHYVYKSIREFVERKLCTDGGNFCSLFSKIDKTLAYNLESKKHIINFHINNKEDVINYIYLILKNDNTQEELMEIQQLEDKHMLLKTYAISYKNYYSGHDASPYILNKLIPPINFFEYTENLLLKNFIS